MNKLNATALLFTLCSSIISVNAYENSFFNNTDTPIGIAIQYTGNDSHEPLYKQLIKPQEMDSFLPGQAKIPNIKWGFCLDHIYYVENPTRAQKAKNFEKTIWKKIPITWTEEKSKTNKQKKRDIKKNTSGSPEQKSLCRDRHFDIIRDKHGKIAITASLNE